MTQLPAKSTTKKDIVYIGDVCILKTASSTHLTCELVSDLRCKKKCCIPGIGCGVVNFKCINSWNCHCKERFNFNEYMWSGNLGLNLQCIRYAFLATLGLCIGWNIRVYWCFQCTVQSIFIYIYIFEAILYWIYRLFATVHIFINYTNLIDSCQAHLPVQYASNIELVCQRWQWSCDWQRATPELHMQNKPLVCSIGCPCSR